MRELLSAEDEVSPHPSFFCPPPSVCASDPWAAAAAAFNALRLLAAEAQALDNSSCSLVEKLVRAAAKRSSATDRGTPMSVQQPEDAKQQQQQRADPEAWTQEEPAQALRQTWQQQEVERQQQLEAELLRLWSEAASQRMSAEEATADCTSHPAQTQRKREGGHAEASTAEDQDSAGSVLETVGQAQQVSFAAAPARETGAKTQRGEALSPAVAACTSGGAAACSDGEAAGTPAFVEDSGATGGRRSAFSATAAGAAQANPCAAGAAATLMELERLLGALQELLNRLYNIAVHAQDAVDVLRWHLGLASAEYVTEAAAAAALPVAPAVPAAQAGNTTLLPAATPAEVASAGSSETARAAALTGGAALAAEVSGCASAGRGAEEEKQKEEDQINREKRVDAEEEAHNKANEDAGEDEGEQHLLLPRSRKKVGGTEEASEEISDFPSILSFGPRSGFAAEENKVLRQIHQQQHKDRRWQPPNYLQGHRPSHERQHVRAEGQQQERQHEEQLQSRKQRQQQLLPSQQQQASHPQPPPSHEHKFAQQQKERVVAAEGLHESQKQQQRRQKRAEEEQQHCKDFSMLLQLCEEVVKTIEGDWRFKQEVKEEMHFDVPLGVFLAAKAAWSAKPYVSDLAPLLCKIAPLAEQGSSTPQQ